MRAVTKAVGVFVGLAAAAAVMLPRAADAAIKVDGPGMRYGSDSWPMPVTGKGPYSEPVLGSLYGGYMGMAGNWARQEGCTTGNFLAWSSTNAAQANYNYARQIGVGTGVYWYMGGPGVDPQLKSKPATVATATAWGTQQAKWALAAMAKLPVKYPVVWADIEMPLIKPAPDNGWNNEYTSPCSGRVFQQHTAANIDRAEFNAFASYITSHSKYKVGVYSAPQVWTSIFGTGSAASIPNTYEWTYWPETSHVSYAPTGWCLANSAGCAQFFGGQTSASKYALMWQFSGGGGVTNGIGDFDQIAVARSKAVP